MHYSRRKFIKSTTVSVGAAAMMSQFPLNAFGFGMKKPKSFGFQVWTVREKLVKDFPGTLKMMAGQGYKEVEMCSPLGYSNAGFEPLNNMSGKEMKKFIEDA